MSFTPGPWTARDVGGVSDIKDPNHHHVADWNVYAGAFLVADVQSDPEANARLIAAAPGLLEAACNILERADDDDQNSARDVFALTDTQLREAVARAPRRDA